VRSAFILLLGAAVSLPLGAQAPDRVATVTGMAISRAELATGNDAISAEARLLELLWPRIASDYVAGHGLAASPAEIEEALAYHRAFERSDRAQRTRKLEELRERLTETELAPEERARLEDFQATLQRLAQADRDRPGTSALSTPQTRALMGSWIEMWKLNRALYERYGGVVGLSIWGHWPHGARAALVADYERLGLLEIADPGLRERLHALLRRSPPRAVPPDRVDFTPYWKRPVTPSYFPD
jgi:hypothetical protein